MKLHRGTIAVAAFAATALLAAPAGAAAVFKSFDFTATGLDGPTPIHSGSFSFSYDDVTFAPTLDSINFAVGGTSFTTANTGLQNLGPAPDPRFILGGNPNPSGLVAGVNDFWLIFRPVTGSPEQFAYTQTGFSIFAVDFGDIQLTETTGAIPEPSAWALLIVGFGLIGATLRRSRRRSRLAAA